MNTQCRDNTPHASAPQWYQDWQESPVLSALSTVLETNSRSTPAVARRSGLTHSEMTALKRVLERPIGPTDLAHQLGLTSAAASGIVDRLVERGLVRREPHASDRRRTVVQCTEEGVDLVLNGLHPAYLELRDLDASLKDSEKEIIVSFLHRANRALGHIL